MSGQHAFLPPSDAKTWVVCAASAAMQAAYPKPDSLEAMEGTAAHWAFEELLAGRLIDVGQVAPNGIVLTDEMVEGAEMYVEAIEDECQLRDLHIEERIDIPAIHAQNWGTPDTWAFTHNATTGRATLYIFDYKFGHGFIDEFENWQMIDYVAGILDKLNIGGHADQHIEVRMTVVQPRCYQASGSVRTWSVMASQLRGYFNILRGAAEAALAPNPKATVNSKCKHCSGRHACQTLQRSALEAADISREFMPLDLPPAALGLELAILIRAKTAIDARVSGLEESVLSAVLRGERIPGWGVESTSGRQTWTSSIREVITLGQLMGISLEKESAITPKQAIKAGLPAAIVNSVSASPRGAPKLVSDNLTMLRKVFSK